MISKHELYAVTQELAKYMGQYQPFWFSMSRVALDNLYLQ